MAVVLAYPYADWRLSAALSAADAATIRAATAALWTTARGQTISGDSVTVGTVTEDCYDLKASIRSFNPEISYAELDETTLADEAVVNRQGRPRWEATVTVLHDTATNNTYDLMIADPSGVRLLYCKRHDDKVLVALVTIMRVADQGQDADGQAVSEVTLRNAAALAPIWS